MRPGVPLGLGLDQRVEQFTRMLLSAPFDDIEPERRDWLRARYEHLTPLVLPSSLRSVEHGVPLDEECLAAIREDAHARAADPASHPAVVLRGAQPALHAFALVVQTVSREHASRMVLAMSRASIIAHELGTCWAEAWGARRAELAAAPSGGHDVIYTTPSDMEIVADSPHLEDNEAQILALAAHGHSTEQISQATAYSKQAVSWHLSRLMKRWSAPNRTALVALAFAKGMLRTRPARPTGYTARTPGSQTPGGSY